MEFHEFRERAGSGVDGETENLATAVIAAAIEVHQLIKPGMPESVYKLALSHELNLRSIDHVLEAPLPVSYKGVQVGQGFIDILVAGRLILELKAVEALTNIHRAQVIGYLQASGLELALLEAVSKPPKIGLGDIENSLSGRF